MRKVFIVSLLFLLLGCSRLSWLAEIYMVKAEKEFEKAHSLRIKKIPYEERLRYYRDACHFFLKAYDYDSRIFTLNRIYLASESCLRIEDRESEKKFRQFEEEYVKQHPKEAEYGEAGFLIGLEQ